MANEATYDPTPPQDSSIAQEAKRVKDAHYDSLAKQCDAEYKLCWDHQKPKKDEALARLRLFNNQTRKKEYVGDTTMFSIFQTVLASLYSDQLAVNWVGREEGDVDTAANIQALAEFDSGEMEKDETDYDWDWDTLFFGRGLCDMYEFIREPDKNIFIPVPRIIDNTTFLRHPNAISMNGNRMGRGAALCWGEDIKMTRQQMEEHTHFLAANNFKQIKYSQGMNNLQEEAKQARDTSQGLQFGKSKHQEKFGANGEYDILQWNTHWKVDGIVRKVRVWLANNHKDVVGFQVLKENRWKVIDRPLYKIAHDWDGVSIPDLTEDKQRARATLQNMGLKFNKADLYPSYIYDINRIQNKNDLNAGFNKYIGIDVPDNRSLDGSVVPLRKATNNLPLLNFIYNSLDLSAQKATATSEIQQGIQSQKDRPLGETELLASQGMQRYSLSAKIWGWSEKDFWIEWYDSYKENFDADIDEKVIRLEGAFGAKWRKLTKDQITTDYLDPDAEIKSAFIKKQEQMIERASLTQFFNLAFTDPTTNRRYGLKELARTYGMKKDRIDRLLPPTVDERIAEQENEELNKNKQVQVNVADDHIMHLDIHANAAATSATYAHIQTHIKALSIKKVQPELFPPDQPQTVLPSPLGNQGSQGQPQPAQQSTPSVTPQIAQPAQ